MHLKLLLLGLSSLFLFSVPHADAANEEPKIKTPYLEMQTDSIRLSPITPKVGPGGEGEIMVIFTKRDGG